MKQEQRQPIHTTKRKVDILLVFYSCLHTRYYLKGFLLLLFEWRREREERLAAIARPPINDYTRLIIICVSSSPMSFVAHFHALSPFYPLSLSPSLSTLIVLRRWIIYILTIIWQWLCVWSQCKREHTHIVKEEK
jgi:uncharacterized membrane protein YbhN (UPF0104 family)